MLKNLGWAGVRESVSDARDREDVVGPRRLRLDLAPEVADVHVDHPRLDGIFVPPDRVQDLLSAEDLARVAGQEREQVEFGMGQLDLLTRPVDAAFVDVDDEVAKLEAVWCRLPGFGAHPRGVRRAARRPLPH